MSDTIEAEEGTRELVFIYNDGHDSIIISIDEEVNWYEEGSLGENERMDISNLF